MKNLLCAVLAAVFFVSFAILPLSATLKTGEYKKLLLLGDSITYGYGLEGGPTSPDNYGQMLKNYLRVSDKNFNNAAVNGHTSADLLSLLPELADDIAAADLIVVTIGGNDLLSLLWTAVSAVSGQSWRMEDLIHGATDPEYIQKIRKYITAEAIIEAVVKYNINLTSIIQKIRKENPDAEIIFLAQYNPMSGVDALSDINKIAEVAISALNAAMKSVTSVNDAIYLDIYTHFEGLGAELTYITSADIHPNPSGHRLIYELIVAELLSIEAGAETSLNIVTQDIETTKELVTPPVVLTSPDTVEVTEPATRPVKDKTQKSWCKGCRGAAGMVSVVAAVCLAGYILKKR